VHTGDVTCRFTFMSSSSPALAGTNICVLDTKLEPSVLLQLRNLVSTHGKLVMDPKDADVVITAIRMRARLERHLDFDTAVGPLHTYRFIELKCVCVS
jgi:hypothetical protein